jgi:hypothetical protein
MGASRVEQLLAEIRDDRVVPDVYSRRSLTVRSVPPLTTVALAAGVVLLGIALGTP